MRDCAFSPGLPHDLREGREVDFYHAGGVARGVVAGLADEACVPLYLSSEDKHVLVLLENVLRVIS